jgi:hypothetical protein
MSQEFYAREILPQYIQEIKALEERYHHHFWLQEDSDPLHGNKSTNNPYYRIKRATDL